ncbi:MAG: protein kinase [Gemmatimonadaceae bacterium]|jgi:hypothetical protein|nr:protein kinase [Gemmatimonadaceae bacterium]
MSSDGAPSADTYWDRLSGIFAVITSMPERDRAAYLAQECGTDRALRDEVESLMAAHDGASGFLDALYANVVHPALAQAEVADSAQEAAAPSADIASVEPGQRIRHFVVHERLGSGGTGVVHRGVDTLLARDVAIKFLSAEFSQDPVARARLVREARAASQLDDPHVCAIHAVESTPDGGLCVVMAYCGGGTLRDRLRQGAVPDADIVPIMQQLARGLACAHRAGIVHGDIKPANVGFAEQGVVRLLDFGVAVHVHDAATHGRTVNGTLPYLAPELWRGGERSTRTDVWALGVTFFELVTGTRPFVGAEPSTLIETIRRADVPAVIRPHGGAVDAAIDRLIRRMLSRDPAARPADGDAVLSALETAVATRLQGATSSGAQRAMRRTALSSAQRTGLAVGALMLTGMAWLIIGRDTRATVPPAPIEAAHTRAPLSTIAVLPFTTRGGRELAYLADGMVDLLTPAFDATGLVRGIDPNTVLGAVATRRTVAIDSAAAQSLARTVRADRYVVGSVVGSGSTLVIRATLRRIDGREVGRAQTTLAGADALPGGLDAMVRELIATELSAPGDTIAGIAAATTSSTRALRAYLDGERALRDARPAAAVADFQTAVAADSMFALSWYRLARAARWNEADALSEHAARRAHALVSTLPARQQALVRAYHTMRFESPLRAERQLAQIVADYPTDVEAWMLLGEVRFGTNAYHGRPIDDATAAFQRVMALDMRNREVTVYLMDLADRAQRRGQLDTLYRMYFSPNSAGEQPGIRATYIALHCRRFPREACVRAVPDARDDPQLARMALRRVSSDPRDRDAARAFARTLAESPATQVEGLLSQATIAAASDDWATARALLQSAGERDADMAAEHHAWLALTPGAVADSGTLRAVRAVLRASRRARPLPDAALSPVEQEDIRHYLSGLLSARLGDANGVAAARDALRRHASGASRVALALSSAVGGHWALMQGRAAEAIAAFAQSPLDVPVRARLAHPVLEQHLDRLGYADALLRASRRDEARRWYESLREGSGVAGIPFHAAASTGVKATVGGG